MTKKEKKIVKLKNEPRKRMAKAQASSAPQKAIAKKGASQLDEKLISITEAAKVNGVSRQAIYIAIKHQKLKAQKDSTRWKIHVDDLEEYRRHKYSRAKSMHEGELIFNKEKGFYSVNEVAHMLKVPAQKIYYATRENQLKAHRKGAAWVVHIDDINKYCSEFGVKVRKHKRKIS